MSKKKRQIPKPKTSDVLSEEGISLDKPLYSRYIRTTFGELQQRAFHLKGPFSILKQEHGNSVLAHSSGAQFSVRLKKRKKKQTECYTATGTACRLDGKSIPAPKDFKLVGAGPEGNGLRSAQVGAVYALLSHWSLSGEVATVVLPTGTGKTETMLATTIADNAKRVLVIVPSIELKHQIVEKFSTWGILRKLGVIRDDTLNPSVLTANKTLTSNDDIEIIKDADVVVSTPAFFARASKQLLPCLTRLFSHVFFDEAHHIAASEWTKLKALFSDSKIVQFTATPYRTDRKPIEGKLVYNYPVSQALTDKVFSPISLISINERHPKRKDKAIADAAMRQLNNDRKKGLNQHRMMVRCKSLVQAEDLFEKYRSWFPKERIALIHSKTPAKKTIIKNLLAGKYDIVVCVDMLREGFDYPKFKVAAVHEVHKSLGVLLQFIGRFARTEEGLGEASFIANLADERMSTEVEALFQDGVGWEKVISQVADAKKEEAKTLLSFLQGCVPFSGFDAPDIELNPKLVYPALSCICFRADKCNWGSFKDAFDTEKYAFSHPYQNSAENVFYFCTQKREKVKWTRSQQVRDQTWSLVVMHFDSATKLLYVGFSDKKLDVERLVEAVTGNRASPIQEDAVFRSFDQIKRLSIVHAGVFRPANHLHRYSRLSGADVTMELSRLKENKRVKKSDFVGIGFRNGFPVSIGASVKGKIWSPARRSDLLEWKSWCLSIGRMITDEKIDSNQILVDSAKKEQLEHYPADLTVLATDWSEQLYRNIHKVTVARSGGQSSLLPECSLKFLEAKNLVGKFQIRVEDEIVPFEIHLGSSDGYSIVGLDDSSITIEGLKAAPISLKRFFEENPPTLFLLNGSTIAGCILTDYRAGSLTSIPSDQIKILDWHGVEFKVESMFKNGEYRENSIQEHVMKMLKARGAQVVFNDDNSGEVADVIAVFQNENVVRFELVHCKYSKENLGHRRSDLYEVCGQAIISLRHKWNPEELLRHLDRRNGTTTLKGRRFYVGDENQTKALREALKYSDVEFEFAIAQPGVNGFNLPESMQIFLGSINSTVVEMTETKLLCYFNRESQ